MLSGLRSPTILSWKPANSRLLRKQGFLTPVADARKSRAMAKKLALLGQKTVWPATPDEAVLETVPNPHPDSNYVVRFTAPEFTSLCPVTGQPDFAHFVIDYVPA